VIARVQPLTSTRTVRGLFDYRVNGHADEIEVGSLLRIPFGRQSPLGVVVSLSDRSEVEPEKLVAPEAVIGPGLPADLVELAGWMAAEYCSTLARALSLMLPPGISGGTRAREELVAAVTPDGERALREDVPLTQAQRTLLARLQQDGPTVAARLGTPALRRLERRGLVRIETQALRRRPVTVAVGRRLAEPPELTGDQEAALREILDALQQHRAERFLLDGVTGSGKTEVYLRAVEATLVAGRDAIVLVPEIALTPQVCGRFQARFGDIVAVLHSGLRGGERYDEWSRLRSGEARVCVGPRSAVLAPVRDVGLIVVDEEHDGSYKHEGDPRYDARMVAACRAQHADAVLVCGSATPRPESVHELRRLRLARRIDGRPLPPVQVLDMRGQHHPLHPATRMALSDVRRDGGKAIVLLNRRGWSNFLSCRSCGRVWSCPDCDVALVLHRAEGAVACHHCGHREVVPSRCGACGSGALARHGAGTERLEHELTEALGGGVFPVFRLDADIGRDRAGALLAAFEQASAGVLVGTQMVAKGHDFPDVALGVVLDADQTLRFPDFRAEERTFALVTQLAGRAGRGGTGRVLVQTLAPDARAIRHASGHDSDGFLTSELEHRRLLGYPPFGSLIRVVCSSTDAAQATSLCSEVHALLVARDISVLGPAPLFRLRGKSRSQAVIKSQDRPSAVEAVRDAVDAVAAEAARRKVSISVDVDPQ
jgi:primosomal protein N' (replication factor Y)